MEDDFGWFKPYLGAEERILWRGRPGKLRLLETQDLYLVPFSLLWGGFAIFWEFSAIAMGAPFFFALFGSFFVIIGLYIMFGRFIHKAYLLKRTSYVITNVKIVRNQNGKIDVLMKNALPSFSLSRQKDGSGSIRFHTSRTGFGVRAFSGFSFNYLQFSISCVENVDAVMRAVQTNE